METTTRPTRMVRARDLVKGATVIRDCNGPDCQVPADRHAPNSAPGQLNHLLTLLDAEVHGGEFTSICVTESGEQTQLHLAEFAIVRVFADSMPQANAAPES